MKVHPHGERLSAYLDGMLDVAQMREVAAHLAVCPPCRTTHDALRQTKSLLRASLPPEPPTPEFWANAYRRMRVEETTPRSAAGLPWEALRDVFRAPHRRWSAGFAAVALLAAAVSGPVFSVHPPLTVAPSPAAAAPDSVDVSSLVLAHTVSAAQQPLADSDRQAMIAMDDSYTADDNSMDAAGLSDASADASP